MQEIWDRIEAWLKTYAPEALDNLREGASEEGIQQLEAQLGYPFPADVCASLRLHNGTVGPFAGRWALLDLQSILAEHRAQLQVLHILQEKAEGKTDESAWWWYPHWIPLANDGAGNLLCVDSTPEASEQGGQILNFDHEVGSCWLAPSFHALFATFAHHLETGIYALDEFGALDVSNDAYGKVSSEAFPFASQVPPGVAPRRWP